MSETHTSPVAEPGVDTTTDPPRPGHTRRYGMLAVFDIEHVNAPETPAAVRAVHAHFEQALLRAVAEYAPRTVYGARLLYSTVDSRDPHGDGTIDGLDLTTLRGVLGATDASTSVSGEAPATGDAEATGGPR